MKYFLLKNKNTKYIFSILAIITILVFSIVISLNNNRTNSSFGYQRTGYALNTVISITLLDNIPSNEANEILDECFDLINHYESLFSKTIEGSDIYQINNSNGKKVIVSDDTIELLNQSMEIARLTDGTVDPTIGALSSLWDINSEETNSIPSDKEIKNALTTVNYRNICIENNAVSLNNPETKLDLGFIAKGYIADKLKTYMISKNISSATINLGGNIVCIGQKKDGDFRIGITDPINPSGDPITVLNIADKSIVSSGNYERFFEVDGKRYHHILSTSSGYPAESGLSGVTIISDNSTIGDMLSTACFIMGYEKSSTFLKKYYPDVEAIFIDSSGKIIN